MFSRRNLVGLVALFAIFYSNFGWANPWLGAYCTVTAVCGKTGKSSTVTDFDDKTCYNGGACLWKKGAVSNFECKPGETVSWMSACKETGNPPIGALCELVCVNKPNEPCAWFQTGTCTGGSLCVAQDELPSCVKIHEQCVAVYGGHEAGPNTAAGTCRPTSEFRENTEIKTLPSPGVQKAPRR